MLDSFNSLGLFTNEISVYYQPTLSSPTCTYTRKVVHFNNFKFTPHVRQTIVRHSKFKFQYVLISSNRKLYSFESVQQITVVRVFNEFQHEFYPKISMNINWKLLSTHRTEITRQFQIAKLLLTQQTPE